MNLRYEMVPLARKFVAKADRLNTIFCQTCDSRALQAGGVCEDADTRRMIARKLFGLAREMETL